jgi:ribosome maturation protein SDO1
MEPVENQVDEALEQLRPIIPIRFDEMTVAVQVPPDKAGKAQSQIRQFGDLEREEWQGDGSWIGVITFPAGMQNDFYDVVNEATSGEAETRIISDEDEISTR